LALLSGNLEINENADRVWGVAAREILGPFNLGLVGLMLACLMAALMSSASAYMLIASALVVRNFYAPYVNDRGSEKTYVLLGRIVGGLVIVGGVLISLRYKNVFEQLKEAEGVKTLNLIIKADVHGSVEALTAALEKLSTEEVKVKVVHGMVGGITESDVNLAVASNAVIIGFNVRADGTARRLIETHGVDVHYYNVIYDAVNEVKAAMGGMLKPQVKEQFLGLAEVRQVFRAPKIGTVAGCYVVEGAVRRNRPIRVLRDNVVIFEGELESLRRFKEDAGEVKAGLECGIAVKNYDDVKVGDQIEVFERVEVARTL